MFGKNKKTAEVERDSKHTISTTPIVSEVSITRVKNPVVVPDPYNPKNKYGVDDRLLAYFYTKTQIDEMDFGGGDSPDNSELIEGLIIAIADLEKRTKALEENQIGYGSQISNLEKHSHDYDGDIIENDLPF